jgi:hypothetical protein
MWEVYWNICLSCTWYRIESNENFINPSSTPVTITYHTWLDKTQVESVVTQIPHLRINIRRKRALAIYSIVAALIERKIPHNFTVLLFSAQGSTCTSLITYNSRDISLAFTSFRHEIPFTHKMTEIQTPFQINFKYREMQQNPLLPLP